MDTLQARFGRRLRYLRRRAGLTQESLAERVGASVDLISQIERGRVGPSFRTIERLSIAINVPVFQLFVFDASPRSGSGTAPGPTFVASRGSETGSGD